MVSINSLDSKKSKMNEKIVYLNLIDYNWQPGATILTIFSNKALLRTNFAILFSLKNILSENGNF